MTRKPPINPEKKPELLNNPPDVEAKGRKPQKPTRPQSFKWHGWAAFLFPFLMAGGVYWLTAAAGLTWRHGGDDGGDLATAVTLGGVPHPTGYPLYLVTGKLLSFLATDPARALTLTTALWGALAIGTLSLAVYRLSRQMLGSFNLPDFLVPSSASPTPDSNLTTSQGLEIQERFTADTSAEAVGIPAGGIIPDHPLFELSCLAGGWLAGLSLAFAPLVWSQSLIIEIYSLNLLLLAALLLALSWWLGKRDSLGRLLLLALAGGLAAGHHRTAIFSLIAVAVFILLMWWSAGKGNRQFLSWPRLLLASALAVLVALLPSLILLGRGGQQPASNWDNLSWSDPALFWQYLSGGEYGNLLFRAPSGQELNRLAVAIKYLLQQFGPVGLVLGWLGLAIVWFGGRSFRPLAWLLTLGLVGHLFFAAIYAADNSQIYLLPFFTFWVVAAGFGLVWLLLTGLRRWPSYQRGLIGLVFLAVVVVGGSGLVLNYNQLNLQDDHTAEVWARTQLDAAPDQAILLTTQDNATFAMWYVQYVERYRPQIVVIETRLLDTPWYRDNLARLYPDLKIPPIGGSASLEQFNPTRKVVQIYAPQNQTALP